MRSPLPSIPAEFQSNDHVASYDRWFRAKVEASRRDSRASIPHDEAMAQHREKFAAKWTKIETESAMRRRRDC
ncbi:stability determinant [Achromobacter sp. GbtcB20]|uniref:type II toxin-antitoxin system RelB family antitoxin n=1 Tax=Achromobacter sp. GbtcB20 TaxID=2824765 RepID=UPI0035305258